jgi:hypothetical protein
VALAGAGMLMAGCGTLHAGQAETLSAAVTKTAAETSRIASTVTMHMQGMTVSFTQTGIFDFAHSRGILTMTAPIGMTELLVPPKSYIRFTGNGMTLPHGKVWLEFDASASGGAEPGALGQFTGGTSPGDLLASLTAIAGSERKLGTGVIRGVPVTEYQVNIDQAKAAKIPGWERDGFTQSFGKGTIPVDVWVDSQDQVRRLTLTLTLHMPGGKSGQPLSMPASSRLVQSIDFYDFGVPVKVSAPPAAQVTSFSQALGGPTAIGGGGVSGSSSTVVPAPPVSAPPVSGSLTAAQAAAAGQAVAAFWAALGRNDHAAVARTVLPAQRSCVIAWLHAAPEFTVKSFRVVSVKPAGNGRATVRFTVNAQVSLDGEKVPLTKPDSGGGKWFVAAERAGHWYVDMSIGEDVVVVAGRCP